jgi:hypothetical protein
MMGIIQEGDNWRVRIVPDEVMYDDSYIDTWNETDGRKAWHKQELWNRIERDGIWAIVGEVKCVTCGAWEHAASAGGFIGTIGRDKIQDILGQVQKVAAQKATAQKTDGFVIQSHETLPDGVRVIVLSMTDESLEDSLGREYRYNTYQKLPMALEYEGRTYGKTGWNSDRMVCYYRDDAHIARSV